jgi:hypothetical protein
MGLTRSGGDESGNYIKRQEVLDERNRLCERELKFEIN